MDKKTLLALVLIGIIFLLWPVYMRKIVGVRRPPAEVMPPPGLTEPDTTSRTIEPARTSPYAEEEIRPASTGLRSVPSMLSADQKPDTVIVETNLIKAVLSSAGGGTVLGWELKDYLRGTLESEDWVELVPERSEGNLGIILGGGMDLNRIVFQGGDIEEWEENDRHYQRVRYFHRFDDGGRVEKEFIFADDAYDIIMRIDFSSADPSVLGAAYDVVWRSGLNPTERNIKDDFQYCQGYALQGGEMLKTREKSTGLREGTTDWVALRTKYFMMAIIPLDGPGNAAEIGADKIKMPYGQETDQDWKVFNARLAMSTRSLGEDAAAEFKIYMGPMDYIRVKRLGVQLEKMMNLGAVFIRPFSIAFFHTLQFLESIFGNFGWSIIVFAILIKVALYPLTRKSYQSMRQMQALQPKINALKEKYKKDPQKLNQETMKLYKQHGVNPMGGCLPLLLQMPVLFALFNLFRTTIMLRQASFLGIIHDLSAPDGIIQGFNLLPIIMGITMIFQQKLATQNPQQKAMAYFMPIFLTVIFYRLSAGLNLYYLMFNVLTIAQEMIVKRTKSSDS